MFECKICHYVADADLNASQNLLEDRLPPVPRWVREEKRNSKGFYWNLEGILDSSGEFIVPRVQKTNFVEGCSVNRNDFLLNL